MDRLASRSKPKIAILAAFVYTAIMGVGMFYMKTVMGITYGQPEMMNLFWFILIITGCPHPTAQYLSVWLFLCAVDAQAQQHPAAHYLPLALGLCADYRPVAGG